jgi:hypothetical protein
LSRPLAALPVLELDSLPTPALELDLRLPLQLAPLEFLAFATLALLALPSLPLLALALESGFLLPAPALLLLAPPGRALGTTAVEARAGTGIEGLGTDLDLELAVARRPPQVAGLEPGIERAGRVIAIALLRLVPRPLVLLKPPIGDGTA